MLQVAGETPLPPPEEIRRTAAEVLARSHYRLNLGQDDGSEPLMFRILRWIAKPFGWLFDSMEGLPDFVRWLIVVACIVLCIVLVSHIVYTLVKAMQGPILAKGQKLGSASRAVDPAELERQAELDGQRGLYIEAVRLLFRAAVRRIELAEQRNFRPGFTNRELLNRYRASPLQPSLLRIVDTIDLKWYGDSPCSQDDYALCCSEHERIREYIQQRRTVDRA